MPNAKKKLVLKVTASKPITDFQLQMKKGPKTVATFKAAALKQGANKLTMKVGKLKAGKYVVGAIGKVDGRDASFSKSVKLTK